MGKIFKHINEAKSWVVGKMKEHQILLFIISILLLGIRSIIVYYISNYIMQHNDVTIPLFEYLNATEQLSNKFNIDNDCIFDMTDEQKNIASPVSVLQDFDTYQI